MQRFCSRTTMPATACRVPLYSHQPATTFLVGRALRTRSARRTGVRTGRRQATVYTTVDFAAPAAFRPFRFPTPWRSVPKSALAGQECQRFLMERDASGSRGFPSSISLAAGEPWSRSSRWSQGTAEPFSGATPAPPSLTSRRRAPPETCARSSVRLVAWHQLKSIADTCQAST